LTGHNIGKEILMKEFMRILVEETGRGIIEGDLMVFFWIAVFTLTSMKIASVLGRITGDWLFGRK